MIIIKGTQRNGVDLFIGEKTASFGIRLLGILILGLYFNRLYTKSIGFSIWNLYFSVAER